MRQGHADRSAKGTDDASPGENYYDPDPPPPPTPRPWPFTEYWAMPADVPPTWGPGMTATTPHTPMVEGCSVSRTPAHGTAGSDGCLARR